MQMDKNKKEDFLMLFLDQPSASSSSEILLAAPVMPESDIVFVIQSKQGVDLPVNPLKERVKQKRTR